MPKPEPKKIVYLFGAGATHGELANLYPSLVEKGRTLLIRDVSRRVIERARADQTYLKDLQTVSAASGSPNIELLISQIEQSKIHSWEFKTQELKDLVREDIQSILTRPRTSRFYLHKALLELHRHRVVMPQERIIGLISLNYDDVLDRAYEEFYGAPNYCFSLEKAPSSSKPFPFADLHQLV